MQLCNISLCHQEQLSVAFNYHVVARHASANHDTQL